MRKIGIIGYGTIGQDVAKALAEGRAGNNKLLAVLVKSAKKVKDMPLADCVFTDNPEHFFQTGVDLVIESAGHEAVRLYAETALRSGCDIMIVSVGAFSDQELLDKVKTAAVKNGKQVILPSAAIAGLDRISAAALGPIDEVRLISRKPPKAWKGTIAEQSVDLDSVTEPVCIFDGTARESARLFPESVNVSAALSLAGVGFEKTKVQVYVDPTITRNVHEVRASGHFGKLLVEVENTPSPANPKTGYIVAMSIIKQLRSYSEPFVTGV